LTKRWLYCPVSSNFAKIPPTEGLKLGKKNVNLNVRKFYLHIIALKLLKNAGAHVIQSKLLNVKIPNKVENKEVLFIESDYSSKIILECSKNPQDRFRQISFLIYIIHKMLFI